MTVRWISQLSLAALIAIITAIALPATFHSVFDPVSEETQIFYSPVAHTFLYREHRGDHDFRHLSREGKSYDRRTFETLLPFIYYRNMELWGLLPITIDGKVFDRTTIVSDRLVFEFKPHALPSHHTDIPVFPLIEANPGQARLQFPEDVFRFTDKRMEFLDVDTLKINDGLTYAFTEALSAQGFRFPVRLVEGKATILKPFDEGYLVVDAVGAVFHIKRVDGRPRVIRTPIATDLGIRAIQVMENDRRRFLGMLLTHDQRLFLIGQDDYRLFPLPTEGYDPDRMAYKVIFNPVAPTASWGDATIMRANALTPELKPFDSFQWTRSVEATPLARRMAWIVFPFEISLAAHQSEHLTWHFEYHDWTGLLGALMLATLVFLIGRQRFASHDLALMVVGTALVGVFGLVAGVLARHLRKT